MRQTTLSTVRGPVPVPYSVWDGQTLRSTRLRPIGVDTETEMIVDDRSIPALALLVASDGETHVVVHPDAVGDFLLRHRDQFFVWHNYQFDHWVLDQHLRRAGSPAVRVLWNACHEGRVLDTMLLDQLLQLATGEFRKVAGARKGDVKVYPGRLDEVLADYTALRVDKDDPYRLRFGELVGLPRKQWDGVDPGFFDYAIGDAVAVHRLYPALAYEATRLMHEHGFDPKATRYDIGPDAVERFGYLGELIQVKASVTLAFMFRTGVRVDLARTRAQEARLREELAAVAADLDRDHRDVLTFTRRGVLRTTLKSGAPSLGSKKLVAKLKVVARELEEAGHPVAVPRGSPRNDGITLSAKHWSPYAHRHPFLDLWMKVKRIGKRLAFLAGVTAEVVHGEYDVLKRTGRTGCSAPRSAAIPGLNLQQVPRGPEYRSLFVAPPGLELWTGDYSAAELRTLAAVCRARFGFSRLGDVIAAGTDPHAFTAAAILGIPLAEFQKLKSTDRARYDALRHAAKALNFGIPGGLGAESLVTYAREKYGATLTPAQAADFRNTLITKVYPELNDTDGYLSDDTIQTLARNLGVPEPQAWDALDPGGRRSPLAGRGTAKVIAGTSTASEQYQAGVWAGLARLAGSARDLPDEAAEAIAAERGSARLAGVLLHRRVATLTGRLRAGVGFCDSRNTPFQGLSADAGKLALWNLLYRGYAIYAFIHDEILVALPAGTATADAPMVARIVEAAAEEVMGHRVPAVCEYAVADHWKKP
jgi:hypothetical protein